MKIDEQNRWIATIKWEWKINFFLRVSKRAMKQMSRIDGLQQLDGNERSIFFFLSSLREG